MKDFSYADRLFNGGFTSDSSVAAPRDRVFRSVLAKFVPEPVTIFQVGAIETFETKFRYGSGWSDLLFGEYINTYGGLLRIIDINMDHLAHSDYAASKMGYEVNLGFGDAIDFIVPGFDIYYLDGADEPLGNAQTLAQFKAIENTECCVIVDDVPSKAQDLIVHLESIEQEYVTHAVGNGMLTIDMRNK